MAACRALAIASTMAVAATAAPYNWITFGDWGTGTALQRSNADAINAHCAAADDCRFVLSLGDQFYNGPLSVQDPRWTREFTAMYNFAGDVWAAQGNHDYAGSIAAQLAFRNDTRWKSAAVNFTLTVPEADMSIVVFDSPRACPSYMSAPYGDCNELCMIQLAELGCTNATEAEGKPHCFLEHVQWLNETLAGLTTRWKFVAAHHPIDQENVKFVVPALKAHGVQAMFAGHIHNLQHNTGADGVHYFISGAGAFASALASDGVAAIRSTDSTHTPRKLTCPAGAACSPMANTFFADGPGYLTLSVDNDATPPVTVATFMHQNGTSLYTVNIAA